LLPEAFLPELEFSAVHLVNFLIFAITLIAFEFMLREFLVFFRTRDAHRGRAVLDRCFICAVHVGGAGHDQSPQYRSGHAGRGFVFTMTGMLARMVTARSVTTAEMLVFGTVLGLGYLAKAFLLPLGMVAFVVASIVLLRRAVPVRRIMPAAIMFALIGGVWITALSVQKGRLTYGDSGKIVHAWFVGDVRLYRHWQGSAGTGTPDHPTRMLSIDPPAYEFSQPLRGTYPVWFDPSYWYAGVSVRPSARTQVKRFSGNLEQYLGVAYVFLFPIGLLTFLRLPGIGHPLKLAWPLLVPAVAALGAYALVFVQDRYTGHLSFSTLHVDLATRAGQVHGTPARRPGNCSRCWPLFWLPYLQGRG
jgi:hypothetical protein